MKYLLVGIGGALGSILRFWASSTLTGRLGGRFPYGTLMVNLSGSFLIGFVVTVLAERMELSSNWRYLISIGFIGGYTTFSAFEYENLQLFQSGRVLTAALNITLSVIVGFLAVWAGAATGKAMTKRAPAVSGKASISTSTERIAVFIPEGE